VGLRLWLALPPPAVAAPTPRQAPILGFPLAGPPADGAGLPVGKHAFAVNAAAAIARDTRLDSASIAVGAPVLSSAWLVLGHDCL